MASQSQRSTTNGEKFRLLLWKNYRLQSKHKVQALMDVLVPIIFCGLLLFIRLLNNPFKIKEATIYNEFDVNSVDNLKNLGTESLEIKIAYSPRNRYFTELVQHIRADLKLDGYIAVDDAAELESTLISRDILAGIEFHHSANITALPEDLVYSLRFPGESRQNSWSNWKTDELYPPYRAMGGPRFRFEDKGGEVYYAEEGFLAIQHAIAVAYVKLQSEQNIPKIVLGRFPYPPYVFDATTGIFEFMMAFFIILGFISPTTNLVKYIAIEKEKQLKEAMKIMGLPNWLHWASWFAKSMIYMTITITAIVLLFKIPCFYDHSSCVLWKVDLVLLWLFLFIYSIATTMYCFMLSVFFSKANTAARVASILFTILYIPYTLTKDSALITKLFACLFSNTALPYGFQIILRYETTGEGLQWSSFWQPITVGDSLAMGHVFVLLLTSSFVYLIIALYVEKVFPGSFGVPEKWYFPIRKDFWFPNMGYVNAEECFLAASENNRDYEPDPVDLHAGVQVKGLRKVYAKQKAAVEGLTINLFDDQITVLLGHNGAGKTTTMSMLTGMFPPTSGTALINGCDIRKNISGARESLGLCPQHNILFDELTVREHIIFFSHLKGLRGSKIVEEVRKYVKLLELEPKMNAMSSTLSGGMKRKLSVGVALCGGSKVVLCDEPSSGMDPAARRALWDVLQAEKKGRTILLSTHFMDEADILGDRIAIMAGGQLKCYGSSFFLKKRFGTGYHLICVKNDECKPANVTNLIRKYIPGIEIGTNIGSELSYELPKEKAKEFAQLLAELEEKRESLELVSYGVSLTTLEEVFMKIGTDNLKINDADEISVSNGSTAYVINGHGRPDLENGINHSVKLLTGFPLILNQWIAMFKKKSIYTFRQWLLLAVQLFIAVSFVVISLLVVRSERSGLPPLEISLGMHEQSVTILDNTHLKTPSRLISKIIDEYEAYVPVDPTRSSLVTLTVDFLTYMIFGLHNSSHYEVDSKYFAAVSFAEDSTIIAWFNNEAYHTAPLSLNLVHNAVVRAILGDSHSIRVINKPLPFKANSSTGLDFKASDEFVALELSVNIGMAMVFVSAFYVIFYIKERQSRAKLLQIVSGVNVFTFWMVAFLWDFFTFLITITLMIVTMAGFQREGWSTPEELGRVFIVLALFGFAMLPMTFVASRFFSVPSTGFSRMTTINIFIGVVIYMVIYVLSLFPIRESLRNLVLVLKYIFMAYPHCSLSDSLINLNLCAPNVNSQCDFFGWKQPGIGRNIAYFVGTGVGCFVIHLILEYQILNGLVYRILRSLSRRMVVSTEMKNQDVDVYNEKQRVKDMSEDCRTDVDADNIVLKEVSKFYKNFLAVKDISIGIKHSECFGLLGVNGAGKTTLFKMLTGDERISSGQAWVRGVSLKNNMNVVNKVIGYCPQFDALLEEFTGRETLEIFCLLRGVPRGDVKELSLRLANDLNFVAHLDKKISEYSGGNKRKLSTAIALIGNPVVLYLDEPTTGMDPGAKRHLWNMICKVRDSGTSIVLTSHSMEECEALCTRLAIMVNGEFKCLGSTQYLKNKFSKGYVLTVKKQNKPISVASPPPEDLLGDITSIKEYISSNFLGATLKEEYQGMLTYYVPPSDDLKWSKMFGLMETAKDTLNIEDYSISQTSLEQVFLSFTKFQNDELIN